MIKQLGKNNITNTPFIASKSWELYNIDNDNLVLLEPINTPEVPVAVDYLDLSIDPKYSRDCDIALEQQENNDLVIYQEAENRTGNFDPTIEPKNFDGTYKRLIYNQILNSFYNSYRNPIQIFGMENIDFPLSKTDKHIADYFRVFNIPHTIFGDKIAKGSIEFFDNNLDDNISVNDDSEGNLLAGTYLFSKVQEVTLNNNIIFDGYSSFNCEIILTDLRITEDNQLLITENSVQRVVDEDL